MLRCVLISFCILFAACRGGERVEASISSTGPAAEAPFFVCRYENPFTHVEECREYRGAAFDKAAATKACAEPFTGVVGKLGKVACASSGAIGTCSEAEGTGRNVVTWVYGGFRAMYASACERFVHGQWSDDARAPVLEAPILLMDEAKRAMASTPSVRVEPECRDAACLRKLVEARGAIWFQPRKTAAQDALVFYPGAAVDPRAYAPLAQALAARGLAVAIVPMEGNLALTGIDRVRDVQRSAPLIRRWFLGGHSLGGVMAARFAAHGEGREALAGLMLWAAYPADDDDLSQSMLPVLSVFGSEDGVTTPSKVAAARKLLPASTRYQRLEGANHAQFGWYGVQAEDHPAFLGRAAQQEMVVAASVHFVRSVGVPLLMDARFGAAAARDLTLCQHAQQSLPNLVGLQESALTVEEVLDPKAFSVAKARVTGAAPARVLAVQRTVQRGQADRLDAPAIVTREVWCKLKNQGSLAHALGLAVAGEELSCLDLNRATLDWARKQLTTAERARLEARHVVLETAPDRNFATGPDWLVEGTLDVAAMPLPKRGLSFRSAALAVANDAPVDEAFRGVHYCKLLGSEEALLHWLSQASASQP